MVAIGAEAVDVVAVYENTFTALTQKVAAVSLKGASVTEPDLQDGYVFVIYTNGAFESEIECRIENPLFDRISEGLNNGQKLSQDTKILYITEYLNIICGRALSSINGILKSASRLTVPKYLDKKEARLATSYRHENWLGFTTEYGNMQVGLKYNYESTKEAQNYV